MSRSSRRPRYRSWPWLLAVASSLAFVLAGCKAPPKRESPAPVASTAVIPKSHAKPELTQRTVPQTPLEQFVQQQLEEGDAAGVRVIVYVGAKWCEPCQRFHEMLVAGELDEALAGTRFLEFDVDRDRDELRAAGYGSKYIPLFSVPDPDGRAGSHRVEGSVPFKLGINGYLVPRLLRLLEEKRPG